MHRILFMLRVITLFIASISISACSTSITHQKLAPEQVQTTPGFPYYLPRQKYTVMITYELNECPQSEDQVSVGQSATIVEETEADLDEHYILTYETLNSPLKTSSFTAASHPNKTLKSVGVMIEDKSAAVINSITSTAISIAKIPIGVPFRTGDRRLVRLTCNEETRKALQAVKTAEAKIMDPSTNSEDRAAAAEAIAHAKNQLRILQMKQFTPTWPSMSPPPVYLSSEELRKWFDESIPENTRVVGGIDRIQVKSEIVVIPRMARPPRSEIAKAGQGVIYRDPMPTTVRVCRDTCDSENKRVLAELNTQTAQLGRYAVITLENNAFDKNNILLTFAANGALEEMTVARESSLEKFAASLSETATQVQGFAEQRRQQIEAAEAAKRAAPLQAIDAQTALLRAKADRIEAENRLRALGGDPGY